MENENKADLKMVGYAFSEYQSLAKTTALYKDKVTYTAFGLSNEVGEVLGKLKKQLRDKNGDYSEEEFKKNIEKELGDVLWYVAMLADDLGLNLGTIAVENVKKLQSRKDRGTLQGSGDNR
jgi:NTP pyrophosphatase (non-canonical NTP hydrolase)